MKRIKHLIKDIRDYYIIKRSGLFDERYYLENNQDVRLSDVSPIFHFVQHGVLEKRNPSGDFNTEYYLERYSDINTSLVNPLVHYIQYGSSEGRCVNKGCLPIYSKKEIELVLSENYTSILKLLRKRTRNENIIIIHIDNLYPVQDLIKKIQNLKNVDVVVTCRSEIYQEVNSAFEIIKHGYQVICMKNEGYDIVPFIKLLSPIKVAGYKKFIKIHTKINHPSEAISGVWSESFVNDLIGSNELKDKIFNAFDHDKKISIIGPAINFLSYRYTKHQNHNHLEKLTKAFGLNLNKHEDWGFFSGAMFGGRVKDFQIFDNKIIMSVLHGESSSFMSGVDSSPYYALEQFFCLLINRLSGKVACIDYDVSNAKINPIACLDCKPLMTSGEARYFYYKNKLKLRNIKLLQAADVVDPWWCCYEYNLIDIENINLFESFCNGDIKYLSSEHKKGLVKLIFDDSGLKLQRNGKTENIFLNDTRLSRNVCYKDLNTNYKYPNDDVEVKVSVICQTYNHAKFIDEAIQSMVMQNTSFTYEILIGDDCSTDNSAEMIKSWAKEYPDKIVFVSRSKNIGPKENFKDLLKRSKGKYIALNEGDDFWKSPDKLQKQYDYMEAHSSCTVCFHQVEVIKDDQPGFKGVFPGDIKGDILLVEDLVDRNYIQTNSVMYRKNSLTYYELHKDLMPGDWFRHILHSLDGEIHMLPNVMSAYRRHAGGIWSPLSDPSDKYGYNQLVFFDELNRLTYNYFHSQNSRRIYDLFSKKFWSAFSNNDPDSLFKLVKINASLTRYFFSRNGFNLPNDYSFEKVDHLVQFFKKKLRIDVVVTSYNQKNYIAQTLDSILNQKGLFSMRVLVSDDCSTDGTSEVINQYSIQYSDLIENISPRKNLNMLKNMSHAFEYLQSEFTAICEGDDYWMSDSKLQKQLTFLLKHTDCSMCFNWVLLDYSDKNMTQPHPGQEKIKSVSIDFEYILNTAVTANFSCCFYKTGHIKAIPDSYFERKNVADWLFNLYMATFGNVGFIPELQSVYRVHQGGQWSGLSKDEQYARKQSAYKLYLELFPSYSSEIAALIDMP